MYIYIHISVFIHSYAILKMSTGDQRPFKKMKIVKKDENEYKKDQTETDQHSKKKGTLLNSQKKFRRYQNASK